MVAARYDDSGNPRDSRQANPSNPYTTRNLSVSSINARAMIQGWLDRTKFGHHRVDPWRDMALAEDYATLWYGMRAAGREVRAKAVAALNQSPQLQQKGGLHPDPEEMQPWSESDIIATAAAHLNLRLLQAPPTYAAVIDAHEPELVGQRLAWFLSQADTPYPALMWRPPPGWHLNFQIACLLGIMYRERARFTGQPQPGVFYIIPSPKEAPDLLSLAHQFAKALLLRSPECPEQWGCLCNQIHALYNATPPEHPIATDALQVRTISTSAHMRAAQQHPYRGPLSGGSGNGGGGGPLSRPPRGPDSGPPSGGMGR